MQIRVLVKQGILYRTQVLSSKGIFSSCPNTGCGILRRCRALRLSSKISDTASDKTTRNGSTSLKKELSALTVPLRAELLNMVYQSDGARGHECCSINHTFAEPHCSRWPQHSM
jgi:hypothetical protein